MRSTSFSGQRPGAPRIPRPRHRDEPAVARWAAAPPSGAGNCSCRHRATLSLGLDLLGVGDQPDEPQGGHARQPGEHPSEVHARPHADDAGRDRDSTQAAQQHGATAAGLLAAEGGQIGAILQQAVRFGPIEDAHPFVVATFAVVHVGGGGIVRRPEQHQLGPGRVVRITEDVSAGAAPGKAVCNRYAGATVFGPACSSSWNWWWKCSIEPTPRRSPYRRQALGARTTTHKSTTRTSRITIVTPRRPTFAR